WRCSARKRFPGTTSPSPPWPARCVTGLPIAGAVISRSTLPTSSSTPTIGATKFPSRVPMAKPDPASAATRILRLRDGRREAVEDQLAVEEPLEIRLGYTDAQKGRVHRSIAITMRTPGDDVALALGFLHAENILRSRDEVSSIDASRANVLRLELREDVRVDALRLERHFYTTSSCGICGKASLEALSLAGYEPVVNAGFRISSKLLMQVPDALRAQQALFSRTGGNHATGLFDMDGQVLRVHEDVGRHNAMDKLVGSLLQEDALPLQG